MNTSQAAIASAIIDKGAEDDYGRRRSLKLFDSRLVFAIAIAFSAFQIVTAAFSPLSSLVVRSIHVGFLLLLTYALFPLRQQRSHVATPGKVPLFDWLLGITAFSLGLYHWIFEADLIQRSGDPSHTDLAVGAATVVLLFEASRRVMGWGLPILCALFLAYGSFGQYLPGDLAHRGYGLDQIVNQLSLGTEGIYGTPTLVSATYIFLFVLFGSFLEQAGMIQFFNNVSLGLFGHRQGGPGKVSIFSSALMGTINGSGVANVVMGGQFTIGLMKRFGYRPEFAGAVEATSSMGGQIMPPVMGAVAFIMAETIDVPYAEIAKAATIPAILYFLTCYWMVHLEAGRAGLHGLSRDQCPSAIAALKDNWSLVLPLAALIYMLFSGFTPLFAGLAGLALTAIIILGRPISARIGITGLRALFWIILGIACAGLFSRGISIIFVTIGILVLSNWFFKGGRDTLRIMLNGLAQGAMAAVTVGVACAIVGVIIAVLTLTGLASSIATTIVALADGNLFLGLVLTMITSLILGMGIPTIPNYIITSSVAAPALLQMGVPLLISHMFVFYFGIMADLTPPVALAAFAAAAIAQASPMKIGLHCLRLAVAGFVIPYMSVYDPALMLQNATLGAVVYIVLKALLAIGLWGVTTIGYLTRPLAWWERAVTFIAAAFLIAAIPITDEIGFAITGLYALYYWFTMRRARKPE